MAAKKKKSPIVTDGTIKERVIANVKEQGRLREEINKAMGLLRDEQAKMSLLADIIKDGGLDFDELLAGPWAEELKE